MDYTIYRKYFNETSYFKIESPTLFEEVQMVGKTKHKIQVKAKQYPEMVRIKDMINCMDNLWIEIDETEYQQATTI